MRFCFAYGKNTGRKSFAKVEVKVFGGQNVVICCVESERDPVLIASLEERKGARENLGGRDCAAGCVSA